MLGKNLMQSIHKSNPVNGLDKYLGTFVPQDKTWLYS
jgi:hypothetical protein